MIRIASLPATAVHSLAQDRVFEADMAPDALVIREAAQEERILIEVCRRDIEYVIRSVGYAPVRQTLKISRSSESDLVVRVVNGLTLCVERFQTGRRYGRCGNVLTPLVQIDLNQIPQLDRPM